MGVRGPAPKPTALKILEGNPGKRALNLNENEPQKLEKVPKPPKWLLPDAKAAWKRLAKPLTAAGVLNELCLDDFAETCQWYAYYKIASREMLKDGEAGIYKVQVSESGYESPSAIVSQVRTYYTEWKKSAKEYGLTPTAWARLMSIKGGGGKDNSDGDEMESLLD